MAEFNKASALSKDNPSIEFNIGEVNFVTKQWQKAYDIFERVLKLLPPSNTALSRLVEFKILLCLKKLGKDNDALILAEKYDFQDDSPFYYFAQAAMAYEKGDVVKAEEWLAMAGRVFQDPNVIAPWQDTIFAGQTPSHGCLTCDETWDPATGRRATSEQARLVDQRVACIGSGEDELRKGPRPRDALAEGARAVWRT